jgi:predicted MFS family arabinose efflux permease
VRSNNAGFAVVTAGYLAATAAESLLAPVFPQLAKNLGIGNGLAGVAFGILAAAIAVGGISGGLVLARKGPRAGATLGLLLVAAGAAASAAAAHLSTFLLAQSLLGAGSGIFFPSGLRSAAVLAGDRRRGLAIGIFGVAFSGGLALGGALAALGAVWGWRTSFVATAAFAAAAAIAAAFVRVPAAAASQRRNAPPLALRALLAAPLHVGGVAAASQYGTVAFLPLFAVRAWGLSPASAALMLTAARIASVPAKLASGNAADGTGAMRISRRLGLLLAVLGAWWTIMPGAAVAAWAAVLFAAFVSGLGPVANVLALEAFEERGELLGVFRSAQIAFGAAATAALGAGAELVGLRLPLAVAAVAIPMTLLLRGRSRQAPEGMSSIPS